MPTSENNCATNLGIVFSVPRVQRDGLEVEAAVQVDRCDDVLEGGDDPLDSGDVLLLEGEGDGCLGHGRRRLWARGACDGVGGCSGGRCGLWLLGRCV